MIDQRWMLSVRAKLLPYLLRLIQLDPQAETNAPRAQQIVIVTRDELQPWLFSDT